MVEWLIIFLICFTPLAMGAVYPWAYGLMEAVAFILLGTWLLRGVMGKPVVSGLKEAGKNRMTRWVWVWPFAFVFLVFFQTVPLPQWLIRFVSPHTNRIYMPVFGGMFRTLSLDRFAGLTEFLKILAYLGIFLILVYFPFEDHRKVVKRICLAAMGTGVAVGLLGLIQRFARAVQIFWIFKPFIKRDDSFYGPFVNPNHFAVYMEMIICLFLGYIAYHLIKEGGMKRRKGIKAWIVDMEKTHSKTVLLFFLMVILTVTLFFSLSRGGMVIMTTAFLFFLLMTFLRRRRARGPVILGTLFGLVLFFYLAYLGLEPLLKELQSLFNVVQDVSTQSRILAWKDAWGVIKVFPFIGIGLGAFGSVFPMFSTMTGALGRMTWLYAHNDYLQIWAELGIGGLILICIGLAFFFIGIVRWVRKRESSHHSREARRYLELGFYTAIFCFLMHSMVGYSFYIPANILLFVVICGMLIRLPMRSHRYFEYNFRVKKGVSKLIYALLLGVMLCLIIAAIRGGYGEGGYKSIGDEEFRERTLKEIPVALSMPLWNNSPYRHYFAARWHERQARADELSFGEKTESYEIAIREIGKAIDFQPTRSLFRERLGYLLSYRSSLSGNDHFSFPGTDRVINYKDAFDWALYFSPTDARLHYEIGSCLWKMGNPSGLGILQKAVRLDPALRHRVERLLKSLK